MLRLMSKKKMLTPRQFAEEMGINYRTALNWLEAGHVPGAVRREALAGIYWEVPADARKMERPKRGPKPKANGAVKEKGNKR
jgi:transcriptional regulator with XRE-family HTH domain